MSTPAPPGATIPTLTPPKCPYCGASLPGIGCYAWRMGPFTVLANFCPDCFVALHFQVFQQQPQPQDADPSKPEFWKPS